MRARRPAPDRPLPVGHGSGRLRHPGLAAAIALGLGMAATAAGGGVGIRHLQKTGLTLETVIDLATLVVGLALLGFAATVAWRALRRWWRLTLVPATFVVLGTVLPAAVAVSYAVVPTTALGAGTPADEGLDYRDVTFTTCDGVELSAWLVPSRNGAAVALKHGAGSTRTATVRHAGVLARHGYGVLMMDARGHGHGHGHGHGDNEDLRPEDYASTLERGMDWFGYGLTDLLTDASPRASLRESVAAAGDTQFLIVAAGRVDRERAAAESMHSADPGGVQVWTVHDAGHTQGLSSAPETWERRVVGFLDSGLRPWSVCLGSEPQRSSPTMHQPRPRCR